MPPLASPPIALAECLAFLGLGYALRSAEVFSEADAKTAVRAVAWFTLPSLILQALCGSPPVELWGAPSFAAGVVYTLALASAGWFLFWNRHPRQRSLLMGCTVGSSVGLMGYAFVEAICGTSGVQAAVLFGFANILAVQVVSYLLFASTGPAFPEKYVHADGGMYRGQWQARKKEGLGVYKYPSGARYEGEWHGNEKSGRGVYYFQKGGLYEGEWFNGRRDGLGTRTFSTGKVKAGRWRANVLETPLDAQQCSEAVVGATAAAEAARKVEVGGGSLGDALQHAVQEPALWATVLALMLNFFGTPLPSSVNTVTQPLAAANRPLALMAAGFCTKFWSSQDAQLRDAVLIVGVRKTLALLMGSMFLILSARFSTALVAPALATLLAALSPVHLEAVEFARQFRLNEKLAATVSSVSTILSIVVLTGVSAAMGIMGLSQGGWCCICITKQFVMVGCSLSNVKH
ncbi:unnamed protein product [Ostreobium quekettii]|uniref:Uncharacterized protein n=1 Tax=Ostreobium quekettii TaxID=121088 RepID=A0A8S1J797_9CHLO|nr:unnamed protein product [Ostreobium quekettii]